MKVALALFVGLCSLTAQTAPEESGLPARAQSLLRSESLKERAWGAYLCGSLQVEDCSAPLVAELERAVQFVGAPEDGPDFFHIQGLLDAMIRLGTVAPPELLLRFYPRWHDEVMILLLRAHASEETLLRLESEALTTAEWFAISSQLLERRSRPFFLRMLTQTRIEHFFDVIDDDGPRGYPSWVGDGFPAKKLVRKVSPGFPPTGVYELRNDQATLGPLVSHGPCGSVHYLRIEIREAGTTVEPRWRGQAVKTIECRNAYLADFGGLPPDYGKAVLRPVTKIRWTTAAEFLSQANAALDNNVQALRGLIRKAGIVDLVDPQSFRVKIRVHVLDNRRNKHVPLPAVASREVGLD